MERVECKCCGFETLCQEVNSPFVPKPYFLCDFCYGSIAGRTAEDPRNFTADQIFTAQVLGGMFNVLLEKMKGLKLVVDSE
jgi:hypothetical protein